MTNPSRTSVVALTLLAFAACTSGGSSVGPDYCGHGGCPGDGGSGAAGVGNKAGAGGSAGRGGAGAAGVSQAGVGGIAGQAGQGSAGWSAGAGGDAPWVWDPAIWKKFDPPSGDESTGCPLYVATTGLQFRPMVWEKCGPACEIMRPTTFYPGGSGVLGTALVNGAVEPIATILEVTNQGVPATSLLSWRNLSTGEVHGAVRRRELGMTGCTGPSTNFDQPRIGIFGDTLYSARWDNGFKLKVSSALSPGLFTLVSGVWGMSDAETQFASLGGKVIAYPIDQPSFVVESPSKARWGDADGDLAVWTAGTELRGWRNDGLGPRLIAQGFPSILWSVALSPDRIVAILGDDQPHQLAGLYWRVKFWSAPRKAEDVSALATVLEHPFEAPGGVEFSPNPAPATWGDWASEMVGWRDAKKRPYSAQLVVHLPTSKTWTLTAREGTRFTKSGGNATFDEKYVYLNEESQIFPYEFEVLRIPLAELDTYVATQPPPDAPWVPESPSPH